MKNQISPHLIHRPELGAQSQELRAWNRSVHPGVEYAAYLAMAVIGVMPALLGGMRVVGDGVDLYGTLWFYWWIRDCLAHLRDPGFTDLFFHPLGKDIFAHTGNNFVDAILSVPFQLSLGFPRYQPVFVAFVLLCNALCMRPLARRVVDRSDGPVGPIFVEILGGPRLSAAAFTTVMLWQACSYTLFEITCGRLTQAFLPFLPLAVDRFLALEGPGGRRDAATCGVLVALQAWTYWFMGHFMVLLLGWVGLVALAGHPDRGRLARRYALAGAVAILCVAPGIVAMLLHARAQEVPGLISGSGWLGIPPTPASNIPPGLNGYWLMERWGAPMLGYGTWLGAIALALFWGRQRLRWLGAGVLLLVMAVGPAILTPDGSIPNPPYLLALHVVPFLTRLWFPYRLVVLVFLVVALCAGTALRGIQDRFSRAERPWSIHLPLPVALLIGGLHLAEQHRWMEWPFVTRDVTPPQIVALIAEQTGGVIHVPIGINQPAIIWQTLHHQPLFGGMGENAPLLQPPGWRQRFSNPLSHFLRDVTVHPSRALAPPNDIGRQKLISEGFRWVLLHRDLVDGLAGRSTMDDLPAEQVSPWITVRMEDVLGAAVAVEGPLVLWDLVPPCVVPADLAPTPEKLRERTWSPEVQPLYEQHLKAAGRLPDGGVPTEREHRPGE